MTSSPSEAIARQLVFLAELDRLKSVTRQSPLVNRSRRENTAEHSWHLAMFALVLAGHVEDIDPYRVIQMLLIHDIVEIDAGDVPIHLAGADRDALAQAERAAAERIFGLLPSDLSQKFLSLWREFEAAETRDACFAKALDRFQPLYLNTLTGGGTWAENGLTEQQVMERYGPTIERGSPALWNEARRLVRLHFEKAGAT